MAYIYKITNQLNQKLYIGKTEDPNPENRWKQHKKDYLRNFYEKRPLYSAMKKYGIDNFKFEILEETNEAEQREIYYIKKYNTYVGFENSNGYNATLGGDGKKYIDETLVIYLYTKQQNTSIINVAKEMDISTDTVSAILKRNGIVIKDNTVLMGLKVYQIDKQTNEILNIFGSAREAAKYLEDPRKRQHIEEVCKGQRKSAYGFRWEYVDKD